MEIGKNFLWTYGRADGHVYLSSNLGDDLKIEIIFIKYQYTT